MSFIISARECEVYSRCSYGDSRLICRGPKREIADRYFAFLGAEDTYGRFVKWPFPAQVENSTGHICINLGSVNCGLDAYLRDDDVLQIARAADVVVIQTMDVANLSNRFYRVHPRRNDRFLEPSILLTKMFPEIDFTEISFTGHLLRRLGSIDPKRGAIILRELQDCWVARMEQLTDLIGGDIVLLWTRKLAGHAASGPPQVQRAMIDALRSRFCDIVEADVLPAGESQELEFMTYGPMQRQMAEAALGPGAHRDITRALCGVLPHAD